MNAGVVRGVTAWPVLLLLTAVVAALGLAALPAPGSYPLFSAIDAGVAGALVLPVVAAGAALAAARLRGAGVFRHRVSVRHSGAQWALCVLPAAGVGAVVLVVGAAVHVGRGGSFDGSVLEVLLPRVVLCGAVAAVGALLGRLVPLLFALPTAVALGFWAFVLPNSMADGPVRLMAGLPVRCCVSQVEPTTGAWLAHLLAVIGALAVALALWCLIDRAVLSGIALVVAAVASMGAAWGVAHAVPGHGLAVRDDPVRCEQVQQGTRAMDLCLWPENESLRPAVAADLREVLVIAQEHRVPVPAGVTESLVNLQPAYTEAILGDEDPMARRMALGLALVPREGCGTERQPFGDWGAVEAAPSAGDVPDRAETAAWWAVQLGLLQDPDEPEPFQGASGDEVRERVSTVMESTGCAA